MQFKVLFQGPLALYISVNMAFDKSEKFNLGGGFIGVFWKSTGGNDLI